MAQSHRNLRVLGTLAGFACALALATLGCGGGTEVAPPTPLVDGDGLAQASLDGVSRGETRIVSAIVSSSTTQAVPVAGEVVQFGASQFLTTANHPLTLTPVTLTGPGGPYSAGVDQASCAADPTCQFWVEDYNAGAIGRNPSATSPIPTGVPLSISYEWSKTLLSVEVSITYGNIGEFITILVHDIGRDETGPFTVTAVSAAPPADGSKAFDATMTTGLLQPTGQQQFVVVADVGNHVDVTEVNLTNSLNPCIQGHLVTAVTDSVNPDPANPNHLDVTFDDSDC